jgi:hypothetical protein
MVRLLLAQMRNVDFVGTGPKERSHGHLQAMRKCVQYLFIDVFCMQRAPLLYRECFLCNFHRALILT